MIEAAPPVAELLNLGGRVALMTGASSGVVAGIARRRGEVGAAVGVHHRSDADGAAAVVDAIGAAGSRAIAESAELLDRAALLSESTRFQRYGIGSPMLNDCCRATRLLAARVCSHSTWDEAGLSVR